MTSQWKVTDFLTEELLAIKDQQLRELVAQCLTAAPVEIWTKSASQDHHPGFARGSFGILNHVKATVLWCQEWAQIHPLTDEETDQAVSALLLHHCEDPRYGGSKNSIAEMDLLPSIVTQSIETIRGRWSNKAGDDTHWQDSRVQTVCHLSDFAASRRWLGISWL